MKINYVAGLLLITLFGWIGSAEAYIDPNTGGLIFQVLAGAFALFSGFILMFAGRIKMFIAQMRRQKREDAGEEEASTKSEQ